MGSTGQQQQQPVKRLWLSWSSGKDCAYTLHCLRQRTDVEVVGLLTTVNERFDRVAMHAVRCRLLREQAAAVGLPVHEVGSRGGVADTAAVLTHIKAHRVLSRWPAVRAVPAPLCIVANDTALVSPNTRVQLHVHVCRSSCPSLAAMKTMSSAWQEPLQQPRPQALMQLPMGTSAWQM